MTFLHGSRLSSLVFRGMEQPRQILENGFRVKTVDVFEKNATMGMVGDPGYIAARKNGESGKIAGVVGGAGGDLYFVKHDVDGTVAVYCFNEFDPES